MTLTRDRLAPARELARALYASLPGAAACLDAAGGLLRALVYVPPWCCAYAARTVALAAREGWADAAGPLDVTTAVEHDPAARRHSFAGATS